jgi:hypothetical protein
MAIQKLPKDERAKCDGPLRSLMPAKTSAPRKRILCSSNSRPDCSAADYDQDLCESPQFSEEIPVAFRLCPILCPPHNFSLSEILCRALCRNPAIPTGMGLSRWLSLSRNQRAGKASGTRMNTASPYHLDLFGVASSRTGSRFDTVEVCGSSPHGPTIHLTDSTQRQPRPYRSIGVTRHHSSPIARGFRRPSVDEPGSVGCSVTILSANSSKSLIR